MTLSGTYLSVNKFNITACGNKELRIVGGSTDAISSTERITFTTELRTSGANLTHAVVYPSAASGNHGGLHSMF